ncbi:MAG: hypothetical protein JW757_06105 [Anaerolineales bacterium]|nr:hypothetical protein [Anaerolineales bacterium]
MLNWDLILTHGAIYSIVSSIYLVILLRIDSRMFLSKGDYPDDVLAAVPPRSKEETRKATILSAPWLLWSLALPVYSAFRYVASEGEIPPFWAVSLHAFLIFFSFWLVDLVVLDMIMFAWITPKFIIIPGSEGFPGYKDIRWHLRGHFKTGLPLLVVLGLVVGGIVWLVG